MLKLSKGICFFSFFFLMLSFSKVPVLCAEEGGAQQGVASFLTALRSMQFPIENQARHAKLAAEANAFLDLEAMGKKSLAAHWQGASPEEQKFFMELLWKLIEFIAYPRSSKFMGDYEITYPKTESAGAGFNVYSVIKQQAEGLDVSVVYHVYERSGQWKIDDIVLDDVSITEDLGGQFDKIIKDSQFTGLLDKMRERLASAKKENGGV